MSAIFTGTFLLDMAPSISRKELLGILQEAYKKQTSLAVVFEFCAKNVPHDIGATEMIDNNLDLAWRDMLGSPKPPSRIP